ncbi:MAG: hypothetical protein P4L79_09880 [Legionella sp.]|uniref:hypothetical protein n=1 Tax=Legionella sp. TaxID=459 RepID=UPI0028414FFB|nr:hypothetical protein [Legionella sp.]
MKTLEQLAKEATERMFYEHDQEDHEKGKALRYISDLKIQYQNNLRYVEQHALNALAPEVRSKLVQYVTEEAAHLIVDKMKPIFEQWTSEMYVVMSLSSSPFSYDFKGEPESIQIEYGVHQFTSNVLRYVKQIGRDALRNYEQNRL